MAAPELLNDLDMLGMGQPGKPIAWVLGLPLDTQETLAYQAAQADAATPEQEDILLAWVVKMALIHGTWVSDRFIFDRRRIT